MVPVGTRGYWVHLNGADQQWGRTHPRIALGVYRSVFLFVVLSSASAYLRERTSGAWAIVVKALNLIGAYGLPPIALFTVVSKGAILKMPEVMSLLVLFVCSARYGGVMQLVAYFKTNYPGVSFGRALVNGLAEFSLGVDFDFYYLYSANRDDS